MVILIPIQLFFLLYNDICIISSLNIIVKIYDTTPFLKANLRHANLSNDEKKSEGEDFAAEKAEEEEVTRRTVFARNYR